MLYPVELNSQLKQEEPVELYAVKSQPRSRLVVKKGTRFFLIRVENVALFYIKHKMVLCIDRNGEKYICEDTLTGIAGRLDPQLFFRANRQYIVNIDFITGYTAYQKVKIQVSANVPGFNETIIISQQGAMKFRKWVKNV